MKPALEYLPKDPDESFVVRRFEYGYYPTPGIFILNLRSYLLMENVYLQ